MTNDDHDMTDHVRCARCWTPIIPGVGCIECGAAETIPGPPPGVAISTTVHQDDGRYDHLEGEDLFE